jgi:hypothetical protein
VPLSCQVFFFGWMGYDGIFEYIWHILYGTCGSRFLDSKTSGFPVAELIYLEWLLLILHHDMRQEPALSTVRWVPLATICCLAEARMCKGA